MRLHLELSIFQMFVSHFEDTGVCMDNKSVTAATTTNNFYLYFIVFVDVCIIHCIYTSICVCITPSRFIKTALHNTICEALSHLGLAIKIDTVCDEK